MRFNTTFNLFHKLGQRKSFKGDDKSVGESVLEITGANHFLSQLREEEKEGWSEGRSLSVPSS